MMNLTKLFNRIAAVLFIIVGVFLIGCAPQPNGVEASDGVYTDKITVTWNLERVPDGAEPKTAYYKVFRAEDSEGPYAEISGEISGPSPSFIDETITPGAYYYYQVIAYNKFNIESDPSDYDVGYAGNTNTLFLQKICNTELNAIEKLNTKNPSLAIGTSVIIEGDLGGTCKRVITRRVIFWKKIEYIFSNYQDIEPKSVILNGTLTCVVNSRDDGYCRGTLSATGDHTGYLAYDLVVSVLQRTGGYYWISQEGSQEEQVEWSPCISGDSAIPTADISDQDVAKEVLFAAYSGIAYEQEDNILHGIMLGDVIGMSEKIANYVVDRIASDPDILSIGLELIARRTIDLDIDHSSSGSVFGFKIDTGPASADRTSPTNGKKYRSFDSELTIDFSSTGYAVNGSSANDRTYYGISGTDDIVANLEGYYYLDLQQLDIKILFTKVKVSHKNSLTITYTEPAEHDVSFDQWNIAFDIKYGVDDLNYPGEEPLNYKIVPKVLPVPDYGIDNRDYTVNGSFTIDDGNTYTYEDVRYVQYQTGEDLFININGLLGTTALGGVILVETFDDVTMVGSAWTSGALPITGVSTSDTAAFAEDGSVEFSGNLGTWSVENWQEDLNPF